MNVGFVNIYAFRPHVEHLYYMNHLIMSTGANTFALTCDSSLGKCYPKLLKTTGVRECAKCIAGGVRSFPFKNITSIDSKLSNFPLSDSDVEYLLMSSSATLFRIEKREELALPELLACREMLKSNSRRAFHSAVRWIQEKKLDLVICFNGRMDMPRAVIHACEVLNVPYITHERTWFGNGIQIIPNNNCLSFKASHQIVADFDSLPLTYNQACTAAKVIADRFQRTNSNEWRVYNKNPEAITWPTKTLKERVLILPSSWNESAGHPELLLPWDSNLDALDALIAQCNFSADQIVLRCHPNWGENIGKIGGNRSLRSYQDWARHRNIHCILPEDKANTYDLIEQSDIVILNGGSSAVEAAACGKKVISLARGSYDSASHFDTLLNYKDISEYKINIGDASESDRVRSVLRFLYSSIARFPQYVDQVRADTTTSYHYFSGGDPERLLGICNGEKVFPDDNSFAEDQYHEDIIIEHIKNKNWKPLSEFINTKNASLVEIDIKRKALFTWIDPLRQRLSQGDR